MTMLLECREWLKRVYGQFSLYINAGIRFITALAVFMLITYRMGYMTRFRNPVIPLLLALISTFVPVNVIVLFAAMLLVVHLYALSMEIALVMLVLSIILYLVYYRFSPRYGFVLMLMPLLFWLKIPYIMPILLGLACTPVACVPMVLGTMLYNLLHYISQYGESAAGTAGSAGASVKKIVYVFADALKDSETYLYIAVFIAVLILVYLIRRLSVDQAWIIAIFCGVAAELVFLLVGDFVMDITMNIPGMILGAVIAVCLAFVLQFFVFYVDYSRTEYVQFEDDEYYYYVKAVPKVSITKREKMVKHINPRKGVRMDQGHARSMAESDGIE